MKKKLIPFAALAVFGAVATSCGAKTYDAELFIYDYSDTYIGTVRDALAVEMKAKGLTFNSNDGAKDQVKQTEQFNTAIAGGAKMLIVNPVTQTAVGEQFMAKAQEKDIPIIFFNREVVDAAVAYEKSCFIGTDPDQAGYMQGEMLATELLKGATETSLNPKWDQNGDGIINYVMLRAEPGNPEANGRTKYSVEECNRLLKAKKAEFTLRRLGEDVNAEWSTPKAREAMDTFTTTYGLPGAAKTDAGGIELVIANNDGMAIGAIESLVSKGYNDTDEAKKIMVVGVDATSKAVDYINQGKMFGSIKQDAVGMAKAIAAVAKNAKDGKKGDGLLEGTEYQWDKGVKKIRIPYQKYTKE